MKDIKTNNLVIIIHNYLVRLLFKGAVFCLFTMGKILPAPFLKNKINSKLHPADTLKNIP